ncbi:MAG: glycerophosphodiester phosphodiesterase family protein [Minwuia sp.]|nr:glycerophosphodiester phosphodiesterase family protein [Minwuia sp.]
MTPADWLTTRPLAHRGLHRPGSSCPENSMAALAAARRAGFGAEIDVQLSADGQVMVFHDRRLLRLTGVRGRFGDRRATDLSRLPLKGGRQTIPTLRQVLVEFSDLPLLIELKMAEDGGTEIAPAVAALLAGHTGPVAVQSFDPALVGWFAGNAPAIRRGLIAYQNRSFGHRVVEPRFRPEFLEVAQPDFLAWDVHSLPVASRLTGDLPVLTWTVRSPRDRRQAAWHATNIIFEGWQPRHS